MASYTLPSFNTVSGTIQVTVISNVSGLTQPTFNTILSLGPKTETLTEELGIVELSTLDITIRDDTSTHSQGFWYRLLDESTDLRIRVQILESGTYKDFFYGFLSNEEVIWQEAYITSPRVRVCSFTIVDIAAKLFDIDMGDFIDDVYDYSTSFDCLPGIGETSNWKYVVPLTSVLGVALKTAGLNVAVNSAEFIYDSSAPDLIFIDGSTNEFDITEVYLPTAFWDTGAIFKHEYWDSTNANSLEQIYGGDFKAFLGDFLFNFGLSLRIGFDGVYFTPYLYQRYGRAYSATITLGSEMESEIIRSSPLKIKSLRASLQSDSDVFYWWSTRGDWAATGLADAPPSTLDFDVDRQILWYDVTLGGGGTYHNTASIGVTSGAASTIVQAVDFQFFDCYSAAYKPDLASSAGYRMLNVISGYHFRAMLAQNKTIVRRYSGIAATTGGTESFQNIGVLRRHDINDGSSSDTYYANKIKQDPNTYTTEIEWIKETSAVA